MAKCRTSDLQDRVERLEVQNRRIKRAAGVSFALAAILILGAQATPQGRIVEAQAFELVNDDGDVRATFELSDEGAPQLVFYRADGQPEAGMNGGGVTFFGEDGSVARYSRTAVTLGAADQSGPTLWVDGGASGLIFADGEGNGRLDIELDDKALAMFVRDAAGDVIWEVPPKR